MLNGSMERGMLNRIFRANETSLTNCTNKPVLINTMLSQYTEPIAIPPRLLSLALGDTEFIVNPGIVSL